ncbi:hypothetical protein [Mycobacteroides abscessus]|uniref:hypothetical protein n=1 Tax=Mycobacteroides abscessus TaxID=36809 RepID=UPI0009A6DA9E|nr:hypothetical protein [Mycobacteroides abscessus]
MIGHLSDSTKRPHNQQRCPGVQLSLSHVIRNATKPAVPVAAHPRDRRTNDGAVASEISGHRRRSAIGTFQHHYHLRPEISSARGAFSSVIVVSGEKGTYVFPADEDGDIADYCPIIDPVTGVHDPETALSHLGYTVQDSQ